MTWQKSFEPMIKRLTFTALMIFVMTLSSCGKSNKKFDNFSEVKQLLLEKVYYDNRKTFYCKCRFSKNKKVRCRTGKGKRSRTVEWEHVVPASRFGKTFDQWKSKKSWECILPELIQMITGLRCRRTSGRENLRNKSKEYRLMESDMYNLVPAVGRINQKRSNLDFGIIPGEKRQFGACDFEVSPKFAEPAPGIRGDIARIYFYMSHAYPERIKLEPEEKRFFEKWNESDPVDQWECTRGRRIEKLQGSKNPILKAACKAASYSY